MKNSCRLCANTVLMLGTAGSIYLAYKLGRTISIAGYGIEYKRDVVLTLMVLAGGLISTFVSYVLFAALEEILDNQEKLLKFREQPEKELPSMKNYDWNIVPSAAPAASPATASFSVENRTEPASENDESKKSLFSTNTVTCPKCGTEQSIKNKICVINSCGTDLKKAVPFFCASCGHQGPYAGTCPECGSASKVNNI